MGLNVRHLDGESSETFAQFLLLLIFQNLLSTLHPTKSMKFSVLQMKIMGAEKWEKVSTLFKKVSLLMIYQITPLSKKRNDIHSTLYKRL